MNPDSIVMDLLLELRSRDIAQRQEIERLKREIEAAKPKPNEDAQHVDDLRPNPTMEH